MSGLASETRWPWWTGADQAELNVLINALVDAAFVHRERCPVCIKEGSAFCKPLSAAIEVVLEWRTGRHLRSKATWLRVREQARQDFAEWETAAA
jgi:hypothetical protein